MYMTPYLVCEFSKPTLSNLVKECFGSEFPDIFHKSQIDYIFRYLNDLNATSVLLEFEYIDRDYLEDYSLYYVKCFKNYGHKCARLHFFSKEVNHSDFNKLLRESDECDIQGLQNSYLGYMVIKPLPKTFIGRTCLKNYQEFHSEPRQYLTKKYDVDLFGLKLTINSIAFQEQDKVVSACATTAIWSALHALHWKNALDIPACSVITTNAINHINGSSNRFPNKELSNKQILRAIDFEKLRHHEENIDSIEMDEFFETAQYHIDSHLPIILGVSVFKVAQDKTLTGLGQHAVTLLGYKVKEDEKVVYIHDDRLGPFVKASLIKLNEYKSDESKFNWGFALRHKRDDGSWDDIHEILIPNSLIVPTQQKARLSFRPIKNTCNFILEEYEQWLLEIKQAESFSGKLKFKIKLKEISKIRQEIIKLKFDNSSTDLTENECDELKKNKELFLTGNYARFQWEATFIFDNKSAFRVFFDATEIPQGDPVSYIFVEDKSFSEAALGIFKKYAKQANKINQPQNWNFYKSFLNHLQEKASPLENHLDKSYGELRVPKYLKPEELQDGHITDNESVQRFYESHEENSSLLTEVLINDDSESYLIWAIANDGSLLLGKEINGRGHPSLTGFKSARIAGELRKIDGDHWIINSKSGRYSGDYGDANSQTYLSKVVNKLESIFPIQRGKINIQVFELKSGTE